MRVHVISRYIGFVLLIISGFLLVSLIFSLVDHDSATYPLFYSFIVSLLLGVFPLIFVPPADYISRQEGFIIVIFSWLFACIIGMLPFIMWGGEFTLTNAWFESVSGFTTTGSSILTNVEALPRGLLFWRSSTHWLGGIGIVVFVLIILPNIGQARFVLLKTEISSLAETNFKFQTKKVLQTLLLVYLLLTFSETLLLWAAGMNLFDALLHSFATIATGGFSTKNLSVAAFNSPLIETIIMIFMLLSGIHFGLLYLTFFRGKNVLLKSSVVRYYVLSMMAGILIIAFFLFSKGLYTFPQSLRYASFQVLSLGTTTGFASADSSSWPALAQLLLIFFTIQCACAGSTSGGLKVDRIVIFFRQLKTVLRKVHHPNAVILTKLDGQILSDDIIKNSILFIVLYIIIMLASTLLLTAFNVDIMTAFSASAATLGNVGPGFGGVSSLGNFNHLPDAGKLILSVNMLLGRLEIYGLVSLFMFKEWGKL